MFKVLICLHVCSCFTKKEIFKRINQSELTFQSVEMVVCCSPGIHIYGNCFKESVANNILGRNKRRCIRIDELKYNKDDNGKTKRQA